MEDSDAGTGAECVGRRARESVPLNRVSGEDLDEKVTTKSGPGEEKWRAAGVGGAGGAEQKRAEREGELGPVGLWKEAKWSELKELKGGGEGTEKEGAGGGRLFILSEQGDRFGRL